MEDTVGTVRLEGERWCLECEPHVAIRAKALFGRISKGDRGRLYLSATDETARDLLWLAQRYPLRIECRGELARRSLAYERRRAEVHAILAGDHPLPDVEMALPPREYQRQAAALVHSQGSVLLGDEVGLGKTVSAIALLAADPHTMPALVVVQAHLPWQWAAEIERFLPGLRVYVTKRRTPPEDPLPMIGHPDVVITTYHKLWGWAGQLAGQVRTVIFDEIQEVRHHESQKHAGALAVAEKAAWCLGTSATPIHNYGAEFYNIFRVIRPGLLGTREEFLREWCQDHGRHHVLADPEAFGAYLRREGAYLRRTRADVQRELPGLTSIVQEVDVDTQVLTEVEDAASELARIVLDQSGARGGFEVMRAGGELSHQLRKATGVAKAPYVAAVVRMLLEEGEPLVLFGWHRAVYEIWSTLLARYEPAFYTGTESPTQKRESLRRFTAGETKLLIMSLRSGTGVDGLQHVCQRVAIGELDWSPSVHEQCIGRVYRDGQDQPVLAYYFTALDGADPVISDVLGLKQMQLGRVRDPGAPIAVPREVDPDHVRKLAAGWLERAKGRRRGGKGGRR